MEEGSLRCEPNISVRPEGSDTYGTKSELKNLNSFKSVSLGVAFEVRRQAAILEAGGSVSQETRGWNEERGTSFAMRTKEAENDYRYFPDPDLIPMRFDEATLASLRESLPELPIAKSRRYREELGLSEDDVKQLVPDKEWAAWFEEAVALGGEPKVVSNWMNSDFAKLLNDRGVPVRESRITPPHLVDLTKLVASGAINGKTAKEVLAQAFESGRMPSEIVQESGATQVSDREAIAEVVRRVLGEHAEVVAKYKGGQEGVKGFLVGQAMRQSGGRANPKLVQDILQEELAK